MKHLLKAFGLAGLLMIGAAPGASAQDFGVRVGPGGASIGVDGPRRRDRDVEVYEDRRGPRRGVVEERIIRRPAARRVCRTEIRERVRPSGVVVRRPVEVCRTVVGDRF